MNPLLVSASLPSRLFVTVLNPSGQRNKLASGPRVGAGAAQMQIWARPTSSTDPSSSSVGRLETCNTVMWELYLHLMTESRLYILSKQRPRAVGCAQLCNHLRIKSSRRTTQKVLSTHGNPRLHAPCHVTGRVNREFPSLRRWCGTSRCFEALCGVHACRIDHEGVAFGQLHATYPIACLMLYNYSYVDVTSPKNGPGMQS